MEFTAILTMPKDSHSLQRAAIEIIPGIGWKPDIIHCNDWQSALTPLYYSCYYANRWDMKTLKTVFTIHNIQYQGKYGNELLEDVLGIAPEHYSLIQYDGLVNFLKAGIECANKVTTVSPSYAREILIPGIHTGLILFLIREAGSFAVY